MPTFRVDCSVCGEERRPTAQERPVPYVCARCTAVGQAQVARRKEQGAKGAATRKARQSESRETTEGAGC